MLCQRIEGIISGQAALTNGIIPDAIEKIAQRYAAQLVNLKPISKAGKPDCLPGEQKADFQEVDIDSLQQIKPRSTGVESVGLHAMSELGFIGKLTELGINGVMRAAIVGIGPLTN